MKTIKTTYEKDIDMLEEYNFDYKKAKPNRFARLIKQNQVIVPLDEDVAEVFSTPNEVNNALRALIKIYPHKKRKKIRKIS